MISATSSSKVHELSILSNALAVWVWHFCLAGLHSPYFSNRRYGYSNLYFSLNGSSIISQQEVAMWSAGIPDDSHMWNLEGGKVMDRFI